MPALSWEEWSRHDATALAALIRTKQVTAQELAAQAAEAVTRINPKLEAIIEVFATVRDNPDADRPDHEGALYGVPIFLKDLGSGLRGRTQDSGSALTAGSTIGVTDPTVENFLRAGLVPLGRSTTPEFGMTFDTTTDYRGAVKVTRSPWNLDRTPGGSSGGSAAAVEVEREGHRHRYCPFTRICGATTFGGPWGICSALWQIPVLTESRTGLFITRTRVAGTVHITVAQGCGFVPVPITIFSAATSLEPRELVTSIVCGSWNVPVPVITSTPFRDSCACVTSISVLITCCTRNDRSAIVIFSLTR